MNTKTIKNVKSIFQMGVTLMVVFMLATPATVFAQDETPTEVPATEVVTEAPQDTVEPSATPTVEPTLDPTLTETPTEVPTFTATPEFTPTLEPTQLPDPTEMQPDEITWTYSVAFPKGLEKKADSFLSAMKNLNIPGSRSQRSAAMDNVRFNGKRDVNEARKAIFPGKDTGFGLIDGASDVNLVLPVNSQDAFSIELEADLSTGYSWQVISATIDGASLSSSSSFINRGTGAVPQMQVLTFSPNNTGTATIQLAYRRTFNMGEAASRSLDVAFGSSQQTVDLSNPTPELGGSGDVSSSSTTSTSDTVAAAGTSGSIPSLWDWRTFGATTPIRDQGVYGTCWAFSTNGAMEANMLVNGGPSVNLSEQFLVSCNKLGFTANSGGYPLHNYYASEIANLQSVTGAVLESDMAYSPSTATCKAISNHPYKATNWGYTTYGTPDTAAIKAALYTHGPVSTGVCVGSSFSSYSGGYFTKDESANCSGGINHYVVLVGWKDVSSTEGYWILRNSWGTGWGESGYMYIKYGISSVGQWTSWVDYTATGSPATIAPTDSVNVATPTFSWNAVSNATSYEVQVFQNNAVVIDNTVSSSVCSGSTCSSTLASSLPNGSVYWRVRALVGGTWGTYTRPVALAVSAPVVTPSPTATATALPTATPTVEVTPSPTIEVTSTPTTEPTPTTVTPPSIPVVLGPTGQLNSEATDLVWQLSESASKYSLNLISTTSNTVVLSKMVDSANVTCADGVCHYTPSIDLSNDKYKFSLAAVNDQGSSAFSAPVIFSFCNTTGFTYTFASNATCWTPSKGGTWTVNADYLYSYGKSKRWSTTSYPVTFDNFTLEATIKRGGNTKSTLESGLVFRGSPSSIDSSYKWKSGYFFTYRNNGYFRVYKRVNGVSTTLINWTKSAAIVKSGWNKLRVEVDGNSITCFINDIQVWQGTDTSLTSGYEGFTFYHGGSSYKYFVDNAILTEK